MSLRRNKSGGPLDVPLLDRVVEDGETAEVPDVQADGSPIIWPDNRWEAVGEPQVEPEPPAEVPVGTETIPAASDIIGEGM